MLLFFDGATVGRCEALRVDLFDESMSGLARSLYFWQAVNVENHVGAPQTAPHLLDDCTCRFIHAGQRQCQ